VIPPAGHDGFARRLEELLSGFSSRLGAVLASEDPDAVHDLRVATRRLQQVLSTLSPSPRPKRVERVRRALRRVRRALGWWRNCDVTLEAVAARVRTTRSPRRRAVWKLVAAHIERRRLEERIQARRTLLLKERDGLTERVRAVFDGLGAVATVNGAHESVRRRAQSAWLAWQDVYHHAGQQTDVTSVHALRIATKRLRYRMELARALGDTSAQPILEWSRAVQHRLGDWHDHQILEQLTADALGRPDVVLESLETVAAGLAELRRERAARVADPRAVLAELSLEDGRRLMDAWLGEPNPTLTTH